MGDICDRCSETDEEVEYGDCAKCGAHLCIECLGMHDCPEDTPPPEHGWARRQWREGAPA